MAKYNLCGVVTVSCYITVEADSDAEAMEKAMLTFSVLPEASSDPEDEEHWIVGELDGVPQKIRFEEE